MVDYVMEELVSMRRNDTSSRTRKKKKGIKKFERPLAAITILPSAGLK